MILLSKGDAVHSYLEYFLTLSLFLVSICLLYFLPAYVLWTYLSLFFTKRFCSTPSMRFLKHWSRTSRLLSGWLFIKVALSSLKYYDNKTENIRNVIWKFESGVTHLHLEHSWTNASHIALCARSLANSKNWVSDAAFLNCISFNPLSWLKFSDGPHQQWLWVQHIKVPTHKAT